VPAPWRARRGTGVVSSRCPRLGAMNGEAAGRARKDAWRAGPRHAACPARRSAPLHHRDAVADFDWRRRCRGDEVTDMPNSRCSSRKQQEDLDLHGASSAGRRLVGEQDFGLAGRASAIMARWRMPPDISCE